MKNLLKAAFFLYAFFFIVLPAVAQTEVQQRVERYLYANYNSNKAALRENERVVSLLEDNLDGFLDKLSKENTAFLKDHEKLVKQYLQQVENTTDVQQLRQFVEDEKQKQQAMLELILSKGIASPQESLVCRKLIVIKLAEHELLRERQEKLLALLKDDQSRTAFIQRMLSAGKVKEDLELKTFTATVDGEVDEFKL